MRKTRPCKHDGCPYPARARVQDCEWHWLARQPADIQKSAASQRLEQFDASWECHVNGGRFATRPKRDWPDGERWCSGCQSFVPTFYTRGSRCKSCSSTASHEGHIEKTFGINGEVYDAILARQGGRCAICHGRPRSKRLAVDHDHDTGEVRGLLCSKCNHDLLGAAHDDVEMLIRAVGYLLFPTAQYDRRPTLGHILDAAKARRDRTNSAPVPLQDPPF